MSGTDPGLVAVAEATPPSRDRYVDFLRAASIVAVVFGHWMQAIITWTDGRIVIHGAVGVTPGLWLTTWVMQVMPIFFFVGGFSNFVGLRSVRSGRGTTGDFLLSRLRRLGIPALVFAAAWIVVQAVLHVADIGGSGLLRGFRLGTLPFGPLWFLGVYLVVTLTSPLTLKLHERFGLAVPSALAVTVIGVDLLAFGALVPGIRWLNLAAVWFLVHQAGFFYGDGSLLRLSRGRIVTATVIGLAAVIVLTSIGVYPRSLVGTDVDFFALRPIERVSNMNPPTVVILAHSVWLIGAALLLRDRLSRWLQRTAPWAATIAVNLSIMTVFLWHMTAYAIVIVLAWPLGLGREPGNTARWWMERPFWLVAPALVLAVLVAVFGRFERGRVPRASTNPAGP
ncbi:MAG TPA: acyltransferase [Gemmatimonadaceae bacterium]